MISSALKVQGTSLLDFHKFKHCTFFRDLAMDKHFNHYTAIPSITNLHYRKILEKNSLKVVGPHNVFQLQILIRYSNTQSTGLTLELWTVLGIYFMFSVFLAFQILCEFMFFCYVEEW